MSEAPEKGYTSILIVAGGDIRDPTFLDDLAKGCDLIIAADGGLKHLLALKRSPDVLIGDLDSVEPELVEIYRQKGVLPIKHPSEKDDTDTELALKHALSLGPNRILMIGCAGDRLDHTLSNVVLMLQALDRGVNVSLVDERQRAFFLRSYCEIEGDRGDVISLLPFTEEVTGIFTEGLKYHLEDGLLEWGHSKGISNEIIGKKATIRIASGTLLVVHAKNPKSKG